MRNTILALAALTLSACAASPDKIAPVMTPAPAGLTCAGARAELATATEKQKGARAADAAAVALVGLPLGSLTGHDAADAVAAGKGHVITLCGSL